MLGCLQTVNQNGAMTRAFGAAQSTHMGMHHECHMTLVTRMWKQFVGKQIVLSDEDTQLGKTSLDDFDIEKGKDKPKKIDVLVTNDSG